MDQDTSNYHHIAKLIAGVDEVGRGPLAGPVVAAAVILNPDKPILGLADSKALSEKKRLQLAHSDWDQRHHRCRVARLSFYY